MRCSRKVFINTIVFSSVSKKFYFDFWPKMVDSRAKDSIFSWKLLTALPPLKAWPIQNGFSVSCWFRLDPLNNLHIETDKPYLYCLRTSKGIGYSGHFVGGCLVITALKSKGKGFQQCVAVEFTARRWHHVVIVHEYSRWRSSSIRCYADGKLANRVEMSWPVSSHSRHVFKLYPFLDKIFRIFDIRLRPK